MHFDDVYQVKQKDNYDLLDPITLAAKLRSAEKSNADFQRQLAQCHKQVGILKNQLSEKSQKIQDVIRTALMEGKR